MSDSTDISQETESHPANEVLMLPGELFFAERVDVPPALESNELDDFAELTMESLAPFPLEHLNWGFVTEAGEQSILLYAALKDRLQRAGYKELESYQWVLPDFNTLHLGSQSAAVDALPEDEQALWRADVRPADFKKTERSTRRTTALVSRILCYAGYAAVLLILLEACLFAGQLWLKTQNAEADGQETAVLRINDKHSLTSKLEQVSQNELRPVDILEAANLIRINLGTTGIEYDSTVIEGSNRLTIEGKANTINELNAYTQSLRKSGTFELIEDPKSITRSGKTTFTVTLNYQRPPQEEAPLAEPEPATPASSERRENAPVLPAQPTV